MRALLDTSSFLWFIAGSDSLSIKARDLIVGMNNDLFLSIASLWEIAIKMSIGKLKLLRSFEQIIPAQSVNPCCSSGGRRSSGTKGTGQIFCNVW